MTVQLDRWTGEFGDEYTARNVVDWRDRIGAWWTMLKGLEIRGLILEVGCNRGHNLKAIGQLIEAAYAWGIEPNPDTVNQRIWNGVTCNTLSSWDTSVELIFTCGVLIHVPPEELDATLRKIHALSRKYILCIEYFAEQETPVEYRGYTDMLWKRNWQQEYESRFPDLKLIRYGFWDKDSGFDDCQWFLWEKP